MDDRKQRGHKKTKSPSFQTIRRDVAHLMRRAGFGGTPDQADAAAHQGLGATLDRLINYQQVSDAFTPPDPALFDFTDMNKRYNVAPLGQWWLNRMLTTARPLQEKMVLFWHGHFATANYKVHSPLTMYNQNELFRTNALGRFDDLLMAVTTDPAMLIWLDGRLNVKAAPNENYGREVMELFTLGIGNYTEDDVHAAARAFTGWRLDKNYNVSFAPKLHDDGVKTYLGQTGDWGTADAVRILSAHSATGPFLAGKLWQFFASDQPPSSVVQRMADAYYSSNHSIQAMVQVMFNAPEFFTETTRTSHIKSPTDFVVSTVLQLGLSSPGATAPGVDTTSFPRLLMQLGQELFNPPNVGGWPGGLSWINGGTMLTRFNFASRLLGDAPGSTSVVDPAKVLNAANPQSMSQLIFYIADMLGISMNGGTIQALVKFAGGDFLDRSVDLNTTTRGLIHLALVSPEYQIA